MERVIGTTDEIVDENPTMNWGAVLAGWAVATAVAVVLFLGGLALGFSAFDANDAAATAKGIGLGTVGWVVLTWAGALFVGGMFASWFDGKDDETMGSMHGVSVWGVSVLVSAMVAACGLGHATSAGASAIGGGATILSQAAATVGAHGQSDDVMSSASTAIDAQLRKAVHSAGNGASGLDTGPTAASGSGETATSASSTGNSAASDAAAGTQGAPAATGGPGKGTASLTGVAAALIKGDNQTAKDLLAADTNMSPTQIDQLVATEATKVDEAKAKAKEVANQVAHYTSMALWVSVLSILIGLIFAALGGWLGSSHVHRVYHLRRYRRSISAP